MANKKIWAYATDATGKYVIGEKHPLKIFYIWETLKLKRSDIHTFNKLTFMSTHRIPEKRTPLSTVKLGFYRYKSTPEETNNADGDSDSLSHSIAIQALAELKVLNFICGQEKFSIEIDDIRTEDTKIQLTNRDTYEYYYPDLICQFSEPSNLARKWGKKLAIEVKHTHECEGEKIFDFKNHCIPIIEIDIAKYSIEKKYGTKSPTPEQLEDYYGYWKAVFAKQIFGRILSNPVTPEFYDEVCEEATQKLAQAQRQNGDLRNKLADSRHTNTRLNGDLKTKDDLATRLHASISEKDKKIENLESRGLTDYLLNAIGIKG